VEKYATLGEICDVLRASLASTKLLHCSDRECIQYVVYTRGSVFVYCAD